MAKKQEQGKLNLDRILNIFALVAGVVALFFSWQANNIASRQITDQLIALSSDYNGGGFQLVQGKGYYEVMCRQVIRLSNLGGATASIVGYEATLSYKGIELRESSKNAYVSSTKPFTSLIHNVGFVFLKRDTLGETQNFDLIDSKYYLPFPFEINAFSTIDIDAAVKFLLDGSYRDGEIEMPLYSYQFEHPKSVYDLPPVEVTYTFKTASGQTTTTLKMLCLYLK